MPVCSYLLKIAVVNEYSPVGRAEASNCTPSLEVESAFSGRAVESKYTVDPCVTPPTVSDAEYRCGTADRDGRNTSCPTTGRTSAVVDRYMSCGPSAPPRVRIDGGVKSSTAAPSESVVSPASCSLRAAASQVGQSVWTSGDPAGCGGVRACQSAARTPPEVVCTDCPSPLICPFPTTANRPSFASSDQRSASLPAALWSRFGKVIGTGVANTTPTGWIVTRRAGSRNGGSCAGARLRGTSEIDRSPVKSDPSGFFAVCGGTVMPTPRFGLFTTVVVLGLTRVTL